MYIVLVPMPPNQYGVVLHEYYGPFDSEKDAVDYLDNKNINTGGAAWLRDPDNLEAFPPRPHPLRDKKLKHRSLAIISKPFLWAGTTVGMYIIWVIRMIWKLDERL